MGISSKQLQTEHEVEQFWGDPFNHGRIDYAAKPANDLSDFVAYAFYLCYAIPRCHAKALACSVRVDTSDSVHALRNQFVDVLYSYADGRAGPEGKLNGNEPIRIVDPLDDDHWLSLVWSLETITDDEVVFGLQTAGLESFVYQVRLVRKVIDPKPKGDGPASPMWVKSFEQFNNTSYAIVKLWRNAEWCRHHGLRDIAMILRATIDAVGDQHGDIDLLAEQVDLFHAIQASSRRNALSRTLVARS